MDAKTDTFFVSSLSEALQQLKNIPDLKVLAGCTSCGKTPDGTGIKLPRSVLFIKHLPELQTIERRERYVEFGSAVTLNRILELGKKRIPAFFYDAVSSIASHNIRNSATIGGNICRTDHKMSLFAPLLAMDAKLEFKSAAETLQIPLSKFTAVPEGFLLSKIHMPVQDWTTALFHRLGPAYEISPLSVSFAFLADTSKGFLGDMATAFCGPISVKSRKMENSIIGSRLPLSNKEIDSFLEQASQIYDNEAEQTGKNCPPILKEQYINLLHYSLKILM